MALQPLQAALAVPCLPLPVCWVLGERWALPVQIVIHPHHVTATLLLLHMITVGWSHHC